MQHHESIENYLESILILKDKKGTVRSIDIAKELGVTKPSVSTAMKKLREQGYIQVDESGLIELNATGQQIATDTYDRHPVLARLLRSVRVSPELADADACRMEHAISEESFRALKAFLEAHLDKHTRA